MRDYVISLTTIPSRMERLAETIVQMRRQSVPPAEVVVFIPKRYRRPEFTDFTVPRFPSWCKIVRVEDDFGPATKILPALEAYRDMPVLYCDDDQVYSRFLAERLLEGSARNPGSCIAAVAFPLSTFLSKYHVRKDWRYRLKRAASLGLYKPRRLVPGIRCDIALGYGGVLVQPGSFAPGVRDIPDLFWLVDDIWLSGHLALGGTAIITAGPPARKSSPDEASRTDRLAAYVYRDMDRERLDRHCIRHFQEMHGLWRDPAER